VRPNVRFQYKIILFILLQLLVVFAALTAITLQIGKKTIRDESRLGISDDLVTFSQAAVAYRQDTRTRGLNAALKKLMKDPQVIYFVLQDEKNAVLFSQSKRPGMDLFIKRAEPPARQLKLLQAGGSAQVNFYDFQNQRITEMWQGLLSNKKSLGYVRLGIDEKNVNKTLQHFSQSALSQLVYIDLAVVVLTFLITFFFIQRLSQPLDLFQRKISHSLAQLGHSAPTETGVGMEMSLNEIADRFETAMQEIVVVQSERMDWVSTLSHEFRSPLQAIKGYAEYIRNGHTGPLTPKTEHILSLIISGSAHFEDFIRAPWFRLVRYQLAVCLVGLIVFLTGVYLWSLEGNDGYHIHPEGGK